MPIIEQLIGAAVEKMYLSKLGERQYSFSSHYNINEYYKRLPDFNPTYKETVKQHDKIAVHAQLDVFPYEILRSKAPNQSKDEWEYQMGLYESYTNSTWNRAKNKTKIIANSQNYSITGWDEEQKKYFFTDYPTYHSLPSYFFDIVRDRKIDYPNQVLVIKPTHLPGSYNEDGEFQVDQTELIEPAAFIIPELNVIEFVPESHCLVLSEKKSSYSTEHGKMKHDGLIFEYWDTVSYWQIKQVGVKDKKPIFEYTLILEHDWNYLPCRKVGGKPIVTEDGDLYYHSWFIDAVPDLNDVIRLSSNLMMSTYKLAFPIIIAVVDRCDYVDDTGGACNNGRIWANGKYSECPSCNGTGKKSSHSPTGVYEIAATRGVGQDNVLPMTPPVQFAAPDSQILEYTKQQIEEKKRSAFSFLFEAEESKSNTATGAALEKEEFHSFLLHFSNELFDLMEFAIDGIGWMRYGESFKMPSVRRPTYFNFRSPDGITTEIETAIKANLPQPYIKHLIDESTQTRFNSNALAEYENELVMKIDRLWSKTPEQIRASVGVTCTKAEAIIHDSFSTFYKEIIDEIGFEAFTELSLDEQKQKFMDKATKVMFILEPKLASPAADIMAASVSTEGAADATSALRGSVGGLTGMIEIVKAVASGLYDLDAAVALVQDRFGLSEEEARAQLGTPNVPTIQAAENVSIIK